ncbi:MAG TPA: hypothetical protein VGM98_22900, partial [Schlesneria sp.]
TKLHHSPTRLQTPAKFAAETSEDMTDDEGSPGRKQRPTATMFWISARVPLMAALGHQCLRVAAIALIG